MIPSGRYVKLFVKTVENPVWFSLPPAHYKVFNACLFKANFRDGTWYDGREMVEVKRGSFITSISKLAEFCYVSVQQTRDALEHMKKLKIITCSGTSKWSKITLLNYDRYNGCDCVEEQALEPALEQSENEPGTKREQAENKPRTTVVEESEELERVKTSPVSELDTEIQAASVRIHARHPKPRRDIGAPAVARHIRAIVAKLPAAERMSAVKAIDVVHEGWCGTPGWLKDGGEFAKGLDNWLAPTKGRYLAEPPSVQRRTPERSPGLFSCEKCGGAEVVLPPQPEGMSDDDWLAMGQPCECVAQKKEALTWG